MYIFTFVVAGGIWLGILIAPASMQSFSRTASDSVTFGITGSVYLAFSLVALLGLQDPLKFVPVLLLQLIYKSIWFLGVVLPLVVAGKFPAAAVPIAVLWAVFILGDLIAIPFP